MKGDASVEYLAFSEKGPWLYKLPLQGYTEHSYQTYIRPNNFTKPRKSNTYKKMLIARVPIKNANCKSNRARLLLLRGGSVVWICLLWSVLFRILEEGLIHAIWSSRSRSLCGWVGACMCVCLERLDVKLVFCSSYPPCFSKLDRNWSGAHWVG